MKKYAKYRDVAVTTVSDFMVEYPNIAFGLIAMNALVLLVLIVV